MIKQKKVTKIKVEFFSNPGYSIKLGNFAIRQYKDGQMVEGQNIQSSLKCYIQSPLQFYISYTDVKNYKGTDTLIIKCKR